MVYQEKRQNGAKHCIKMIAPASVVVKAGLQIDSISKFLFVEVASKTREFFPITIEAKAHIKKNNRISRVININWCKGYKTDIYIYPF